MFSTTIAREKLLDLLRKNRATHYATFEKAFDAYRAAVIKETEDNLTQFKAGKSQHIMIRLVVPSDHTKEYDAVIGLLEASTQAEVTLDTDDYSQFVLDDWSWKGQWLASNATYGVS